MFCIGVLGGGLSLGGIIFAKMLATGKEKDPAIDADPELLQKARQNPKGEGEHLSAGCEMCKLFWMNADP